MKHQIYRPVLVALLGIVLIGASADAATGEKRLLDERSFRLDKHGSDQALLTIDESGALVIKVQVKKPLPTLPIRLLLEGPDGLRVEKLDTAPLRLRYFVSATQIGGAWRASVINASNMGPVTGKVTIELEPGAIDPVGRRTGGESRSKSRMTGSRVRVVNDQKIRASCRDRNSDVFRPVEYGCRHRYLLHELQSGLFTHSELQL